ncbi:hypothetical protein [Maritalea sp.]|uniref:hypothetical protein n=1 Tax=Maritalea sp. TaxID=2003361 RepID=UPI003EF3CFA2
MNILSNSKFSLAAPIVFAFAFAMIFAAPQNAFSYSTSPTPVEDVEQHDGETFDQNERIVLPNAPGKESRQPFQNHEIKRDLAELPDNVAQTRAALMAVAKSGDVEQLRTLIMRQTNAPVLTFGDTAEPIEFLRSSSNDGEGRELLAIMIELLEAPYSIVPAQGGEPEIFVWPAYATNDLKNLTPSELVEVYKIVSHLDLEEMQLFGGWYFYRVGIDANGEWRYFVAGD